jgi:peptidoglycan/LPS O-acetylase OafA/YrhL
MASPTTAHARLAGLDGLRAIAVLLVVVYHLFPESWLRGGFVGVDVFFVISGFLITTLLLREIGASGRIRFLRFWRRRARRLLPALLALLTVCSTVAWLIGGDVLVRLGPQLLGAVTFSYNWISIAGGGGYFSDSTPELFRNLWSLAVEEQFYVVWPLLLPLVLLIPRVRVRVIVILAASAASAVWMGVVVLSGTDLTRAYFGTDTHAFGILLGVALAFGLHGMRGERAWMRHPLARVGAASAGVLALAGLVAVATVPESPTLVSFPGTIAAASLLGAVVVVAGLWPGAGFGRVLDVAPLRWIGDRSYGIYLWHWPLLVLLMAGFQGAATSTEVPLAIGVAALVLTFAAAELSARFLETPVRRHGFRGAFRRLGQAMTGRPQTRFGAIAGVVAGLLVLGGTSAALAAAPHATSSESAIDAGAAAVAEAGAAPDGTPDEPVAAPVPPGPSPVPITGDQITAVGDSVMLASAPSLLARFPGIQIDAEVSRGMWKAPGILQGLADRGELRPFVVVALGTNGPIEAAALDEIERVIGPDRHLILVNAFAPRDWIDGVNGELRSYADSHADVHIADWSAAISGRTDLLAGDRIHPGNAGGQVFADAVAAAIDAAERERALRQYQDERNERLRNSGIVPLEPQ